MFKKRKGIKVPYNKQGLIYFTCMNIKNLPEEKQEEIKTLCKEVTEEYADALYTLLTDDTLNIYAVARRYYIGESQLYQFRKKFYERYNIVITEGSTNI